MTSRIAAINAYRPKVKLGRTAGTDELVEFIARSMRASTGSARG
jgi:hypothetical protein